MKIGVIMGGPSSEREISILTGNEMINNLNKEKYEIIKIIIDSKKDLIDKLLENKIDFALLALHGNFGEDGGAQAILEGMGIPYSGCGVTSSALCMDKDISKKLMQYERLITPDWITVKKGQEIDYKLLKKIGYPLVIKPIAGGSSIGTFIANGEEDVMDCIQKGFDYDERIMIEKYIKGTEITCSILDGNVLPVLLIKPASGFFDFKSKYSLNGTEESVINLDKDIKDKIDSLCTKCWDLFKCSVYARIDIIISEDTPYILEINTLPGMTQNSLFPKSAKAYGISFMELMDIIINTSINIKR